MAVKIWSSPTFLALTPIKPCGQGLFLFLITGTVTSSVPGVIVAGIGTLADRLRWSPAATKKALAEIEKEGAVIVDHKAGLLYLPAGLAHNQPSNPNVVRSWREQWALVPSCNLRDSIAADFATQLAALGDGYVDAWASVQAGVRGGVPGSFGRNHPYTQTRNHPSDGSDEPPTEHSDLISPEPSPHAYAHARPAPAPVSVRDPERATQTDHAEHRQIRTAYAEAVSQATAMLYPGIPQFAEEGMALEGLWRFERTKGATLAEFLKFLNVSVAMWVSEVRAKGETRFTGGWKPSKFVAWLADRNGPGLAVQPRSPATAVYIPPDTSDAVPAPKGFLDALAGIGGPSPKRGRA